MALAFAAEADRLERRIDRVHADIRRNPTDRASLAPFLRKLEEDLAQLMERGECGHTVASGHTCAREAMHPGAHIAVTGEWWPWAFEGTHYIGQPFTGAPLAHA